MNFKTFFAELFGNKDITPPVRKMLFHLYNSDGRLKGSCAFERFEDLQTESGKTYHLYAVATTKADKTDAPSAEKAFGKEETETRVAETLDYFAKHRNTALSVLKEGRIVWANKMTCIIPLEDFIVSMDARTTISYAMKNSNDICSWMPRFLKKTKTRREL